MYAVYRSRQIKNIKALPIVYIVMHEIEYHTWIKVSKSYKGFRWANKCCKEMQLTYLLTSELLHEIKTIR